MTYYKENKRLITEIMTLHEGRVFVEKQLKDTDTITSIEFSKNYLAFSVDSMQTGRISILDLETMQECFSYVHSSIIIRMAFPSNERYLLIHDEVNKFYKVYFRENKSEYLFKTKKEVSSISFKPNTEIVAFGLYDNYPHVMNIKEGIEIIHKLIDESRSSYSVTFSNDGEYLAYGNSNSEVVLYEANAFKLLSRKKTAIDGEIDIIKFSDNNKKLLTASKEPFVRIWDLPSLSQIEKLKLTHFGINDFHYSSEREYILSSFMNKTLLIWDLNKSKIYSDIYKNSNTTDLESTSNLAKFSNDGRYLATTYGFNNTALKIYVATIPTNHKEIIENYLNKIAQIRPEKRSNYGVSDPQTFDDFY